MPLTVEWKKFVEEYRSNDVYWYFPKGAVDEKAVRGSIVGRAVDVKLQYAAKAVPDGLVGLVTFELSGEKGKEGWIKIDEV